MTMPLERYGKLFVNATEASELLGVSGVTFLRMREDFKLPTRSFPGQGRSVWFQQAHIELIRDDPDKAKEQAEAGWPEE